VILTVEALLMYEKANTPVFPFSYSGSNRHSDLVHLEPGAGELWMDAVQRTGRNHDKGQKH
jgi:hypothetical protein